MHYVSYDMWKFWHIYGVPSMFIGTALLHNRWALLHNRFFVRSLAAFAARVRADSPPALAPCHVCWLPRSLARSRLSFLLFDTFALTYWHHSPLSDFLARSRSLAISRVCLVSNSARYTCLFRKLVHSLALSLTSNPQLRNMYQKIHFRKYIYTIHYKYIHPIHLHAIFPFLHAYFVYLSTCT